MGVRVFGRGGEEGVVERSGSQTIEQVLQVREVTQL